MTIQKTSGIKLSKRKRKLITKPFVVDLISYLQSSIFQEPVEVHLSVLINENMIVYDVREFVENYSNSAGFEELTINACDKHNNSFRIIISSAKILISFMTFTTYTVAQAEELTDKLRKYILGLIYERDNSHTDSDSAAGSVNNARYNPWYKESWIWNPAGVIVTAIGIIVSILMSYCCSA